MMILKMEKVIIILNMEMEKLKLMILKMDKVVIIMEMEKLQVKIEKSMNLKNLHLQKRKQLMFQKSNIPNQWILK